MCPATGAPSKSMQSRPERPAKVLYGFRGSFRSGYYLSFNCRLLGNGLGLGNVVADFLLEGFPFGAQRSIGGRLHGLAFDGFDFLAFVPLGLLDLDDRVG